MANLWINFLIIPFMILAYYQSLQLTAMLGAGQIYFYLFLFVFSHIFASGLVLLSNYSTYGHVKTSMVVTGIAPTIVAILTLMMISIFPIFKWPFYLFKWLPWFDLIIDPLIMGFMAWITMNIMDSVLTPSIYDKPQ